ncbi:hypothetical protein M1O54_02180 [Dehalococcoidia bacterium]|nr:hypothetical protein [Dehalococcoidia bacterium]MCL0078447.1 hypothetical protein [Dehalococcoidia bacterium]MCL0089158.1 hypothetical protein [Dehalococcoidia bacterium]
MDVVRSKNGVPIRLTEERWIHITEEHSEMAGYYFEVVQTVDEPEAIVITAFLTRRRKQLERRRKIWQQ